MKKILALLSLIHFLGFSQNPEIPFKDGESCSYSIRYGIFGGGHAKYTVIQDNMETKVVVKCRVILL